jgi:hypothetical protein
MSSINYADIDARIEEALAQERSAMLPIVADIL